MSDIVPKPPHKGDHTLDGIFSPGGFGHKLGPLPVWGWAFLLGAAVFLYFHFRGSSSTSSTTGAPTADTTDEGFPGYSDTGDYGSTALSGSGTSTGNGDTSYSNNDSWEAAAISQAATFGSTPLAVQQALDTGLSGGTFGSATQESLWNEILTSLGAPPSGTQGTPGDYVAPAKTSTTATSKTGNPWTTGSVYALGSSSGGQFVVTNGKAQMLTSAQVNAARKAGYNYQTVVVKSMSQAGVK